MATKIIYNDDLLVLESNEIERAIELKWLGKSVEREPGKILNPIFSDLLMQGKKENKRIIVDFSFLDYMNSSTIMTISKFLEKGKDSENQITVRYNSSRRWQKMSFNALKIFQTSNGSILFEGLSKE